MWSGGGAGERGGAEGGGAGGGGAEGGGGAVGKRMGWREIKGGKCREDEEERGEWRDVHEEWGEEKERGRRGRKGGGKRRKS